MVDDVRSPLLGNRGLQVLRIVCLVLLTVVCPVEPSRPSVGSIVSAEITERASSNLSQASGVEVTGNTGSVVDDATAFTLYTSPEGSSVDPKKFAALTIAKRLATLDSVATLFRRLGLPEGDPSSSEVEKKRLRQERALRYLEKTDDLEGKCLNEVFIQMLTYGYDDSTDTVVKAFDYCFTSDDDKGRCLTSLGSLYVVDASSEYEARSTGAIDAAMGYCVKSKDNMGICFTTARKFFLRKRAYLATPEEKLAALSKASDHCAKSEGWGYLCIKQAYTVFAENGYSEEEALIKGDKYCVATVSNGGAGDKNAECLKEARHEYLSYGFDGKEGREAVEQAAAFCEKSVATSAACLSRVGYEMFFKDGGNNKDKGAVLARASKYCVDSGDPQGLCFLNAEQSFVDLGYARRCSDCQMFAEDYCTHTNDTDAECFQYATSFFFSHGHKNPKDAVRLSRGFCTQTTDTGCLGNTTTAFFHHGYNAKLDRDVASVVSMAMDFCIGVGDVHCLVEGSRIFYHHGFMENKGKTAIDMAGAYCKKRADTVCLGNSTQLFFQHGFSEDSGQLAAKMAAKYCAVSKDVSAKCLMSTQSRFFENGYRANDGRKSVDMARIYCLKPGFDEECFETAHNQFLSHGYKPGHWASDGVSAVMRAAEYCAVANDKLASCLLKGTEQFFYNGFAMNGGRSAVDKAADYCPRSADVGAGCLYEAVEVFFARGYAGMRKSTVDSPRDHKNEKWEALDEAANYCRHCEDSSATCLKEVSDKFFETGWDDNGGRDAVDEAAYYCTNMRVVVAHNGKDRRKHHKSTMTQHPDSDCLITTSVLLYADDSEQGHKTSVMEASKYCIASCDSDAKCLSQAMTNHKTMKQSLDYCLDSAVSRCSSSLRRSQSTWTTSFFIASVAVLLICW